MTLSRSIILCGILFMTVGFLLWIFKDNGQWALAGIALFFGCLLTGAVLSVDANRRGDDTNA